MAKKTPSRIQRWERACAKVRDALTDLREVIEDEVNTRREAVSSALEELKSVREEYEDWRDNMSENLHGSATYEKLEAVCDLDLDNADGLAGTEDLLGEIQEIENLIDEAEQLDLPRGFGRD